MEIDLHGYTLEAAQDRVHQCISAVRMNGSKQSVDIITGHGVIKEATISLLTQYGLEHTIKLGNTGTIVVIID